MMTGMPAASTLAFASSLITPSCIVDYAVLHPDVLGAHLYRLVDHGHDLVGAAEDVDHVDGFGNGLEVRVAFLPKGLFDHRIDRDNPVALALHVTGDPVAVPVGVVGKTDDRDGLAVS